MDRTPRAAEDRHVGAAGGTFKAMSPQPIYRGRVKFFLEEKGWGAIVSPELPHDVWVHFGHIDREGFRALSEGDEVEFRYEECWGNQDSWHYRTTWARPVRPAR